MLYEKMLAGSARLNQRLQTLQKDLQNYPEGKLICSQNGKYFKYYWKRNDGLQYLHKSYHDVVAELAVKKYLTYSYMDLLHEKKAIEQYLKSHHSYHEKAPDMLLESAGYRKFLLPYFSKSAVETTRLSSSVNSQNPNHPEQLIHKTLSGHMVRSKSESLIDTSLFMNKISFRYECALFLEDICFYPDFTILHPETGNILYWEHFGMMDNPAYAKRFIQSSNSIRKITFFLPST